MKGQFEKEFWEEKIEKEIYKKKEAC